MALTKISTEGFKDDAVTTDKIADSINSERTANTAKDLTALSASNLTSGTVPDARFPATLPAKSAANLTNIPAANITGALPAISGASLTNLPASGKASNLFINGAMNVNQKAVTTATGSGYKTVDRWNQYYNNLNADITMSWQDVASGTTPYTKGFRKSVRLTNGNQGSAQANFISFFRQQIEAQDMATSGWNYTSASSYITLQFWVKSSVAQNFYFRVHTSDGTVQAYVMETGSLTADTWTLITKTISGNSNLQFDNNTDEGFRIEFIAYYGGDRTGTRPLNAWAAEDGATRCPDVDASWIQTNSATLEFTGFQLEVGESASDFAHERYADTLRKCQRYYWKIAQNKFRRVNGYKRGDSQSYWELQCPVPMRTAPSPTLLASGTFTDFQSNFNTTQSGPNVNEWNQDTGWGLLYVSSNWSGSHDSIHSWEGYSIEFSAEL